MRDDLPRSENRTEAQPVPAIFTFPNRILFGEGVRSLLAAELARLGISRPLVVTDRGLMASGRVDEVTGRLESATVFGEVHANPTEGDVLAALQVYHDERCDGVVGLGG